MAAIVGHLGHDVSTEVTVVVMHFPCWGKSHCAINTTHRYAVIHKTKWSKRELHNYVDKL